VVVGWSAGTHGADQRLVRLADGERQWTTDPGERFLSILGSHDGTTFVGTGDDALGLSGETVHAVGPDGNEHWRVESGDAYQGTVHDETPYVPYGHRRTTALDVETGVKRWRRVMEPAGEDLRVFGDTLYLGAGERNDDGDYPVVAVDAATGAERWRYAAEGGNEGAFAPTGAVEGPDGRVYGTEYGDLPFALERGPARKSGGTRSTRTRASRPRSSGRRSPSPRSTADSTPSAPMGSAAGSARSGNTSWASTRTRQGSSPTRAGRRGCPTG